MSQNRALMLSTIALTLTLTLVLVWGMGQYRDARAAEYEAEALCQRSLEGFFGGMEAQYELLGKLKAAFTAEQYQALLMDLFRRSGDTALALSQLPLNVEKQAGFMQFVNRAGDFAAYLSRRIARNGLPEEKDLEQLASLEKAFGELLGVMRPAREVKALERLRLSTISVDALTSDTIGSYEFPTLLYDGPFSESALNKAPRAPLGERVDMGAADAVARKLVGSDTIFTGTLLPQSPIPYYWFTGCRFGCDLNVAVTRDGGKPLWWIEDAKTLPGFVPTEQQRLSAFGFAKKILEDNGFSDMTAIRWQHADGIGVICFVATQEGVLLYPDMVKVWVDISRQRVIGMDAKRYHMSHAERDLPQSRLTSEEVKATENVGIQDGPARLTLIPLAYGEEALCYEFHASLGGGEYLIYIDALTGQERDIQRMVKTEFGTLVR